LGFTLNHVYQFRDKVDVVEGSEPVEYMHTDKETEHILNIFSGKEELNEKEKTRILRSCTISWSRNQNVLVPDDIEDFNLENLKKFCKENLEKIGETDVVEYADAAAKQMYFMENTYKTLWSLENKSGSPYIRWDDSDPTTYLLSEGKHKAHYNSLTNTIYINPEDLNFDMSKDFVAELAHTQQFNDKAVSSYLTYIRDVLKTATISILQNEGFNTTYSKLYDSPGTLEYDAHKVREEKLAKEVQKARENDYKNNLPESYNTRGY
jgi:hypothetical protein